MHECGWRISLLVRVEVTVYTVSCSVSDEEGSEEASKGSLRAPKGAPKLFFKG